MAASGGRHRRRHRPAEQAPGRPVRRGELRDLRPARPLALEDVDRARLGAAVVVIGRADQERAAGERDAVAEDVAGGAVAGGHLGQPERRPGRRIDIPDVDRAGRRSPVVVPRRARGDGGARDRHRPPHLVARAEPRRHQLGLGEAAVRPPREGVDGARGVPHLVPERRSRRHPVARDPDREAELIAGDAVRGEDLGLPPAAVVVAGEEVERARRGSEIVVEHRPSDRPVTVDRQRTGEQVPRRRVRRRHLHAGHRRPRQLRYRPGGSQERGERRGSDPRPTRKARARRRRHVGSSIFQRILTHGRTRASLRPPRIPKRAVRVHWPSRPPPTRPHFEVNVSTASQSGGGVSKRYLRQRARRIPAGPSPG